MIILHHHDDLRHLNNRSAIFLEKQRRPDSFDTDRFGPERII
jgi:hypothetical protein